MVKTGLSFLSRSSLLFGVRSVNEINGDGGKSERQRRQRRQRRAVQNFRFLVVRSKLSSAGRASDKNTIRWNFASSSPGPGMKGKTRPDVGYLGI